MILFKREVMVQDFSESHTIQFIREVTLPLVTLSPLEVHS